MGQLGSAAGFAGSLFQGSQDLAQSMSIDVVQAEQVLGQAAASSGAGRRLEHISGLPSNPMRIELIGKALLLCYSASGLSLTASDGVLSSFHCFPILGLQAGSIVPAFAIQLWYVEGWLSSSTP